jgi:hypothetical protein
MSDLYDYEEPSAVAAMRQRHREQAIAAAKEELIMGIRRYLESYGEIDPTCCDECKELYGIQQTIKALDALQKEGK